jgi:hypothetical protein
MKIVVKRKTGFHSNERVIIYDFRNQLFYDSIWAGNFIGLFNLPIGTYYTNSNITKLNKPVKTPYVPLPKRERNKKMPKRLIIKYAENPSKATIFHDTNTIVFDTSFLRKPLYVVYFIMFHELGHKLYKTEHKADLYATKRMFGAGFNQSQIMLAPFQSLSSKNHFRRSLILKKAR